MFLTTYIYRNLTHVHTRTHTTHTHLHINTSPFVCHFFSNLSILHGKILYGSLTVKWDGLYPSVIVNFVSSLTFVYSQNLSIVITFTSLTQPLYSFLLGQIFNVCLYSTPWLTHRPQRTYPPLGSLKPLTDTPTFVPLFKDRKYKHTIIMTVICYHRLSPLLRPPVHNLSQNLYNLDRMNVWQIDLFKPPTTFMTRPWVFPSDRPLSLDTSLTRVSVRRLTSPPKSYFETFVVVPFSDTSSTALSSLLSSSFCPSLVFGLHVLQSPPLIYSFLYKKNVILFNLINVWLPFNVIPLLNFCTWLLPTHDPVPKSLSFFSTPDLGPTFLIGTGHLYDLFYALPEVKF